VPRHIRATGVVNCWLTLPDRNEKKHIINALREGARLTREAFDSRFQLAHVVDDPVRFEVRDGNIRIAE
jgi:hypothetical protein